MTIRVTESTEEKAYYQERDHSVHSVTGDHSVTECLEPIRPLLRPDIDAERLGGRLQDTAAARPWERGLFSFLRELCGLLVLVDAEDRCRVTAFRELLMLWWRAANLDLVTADDVLGHAAEMWPKIERPAGTDALSAATEEIRSGRVVLPADLDGCDQVTCDVAALCIALAQQSANVKAGLFFVSARTAAAHAGTDAMTANRRLKLLQDLGLMVQMEPGRPGRAARYRWLGMEI